MFTLTYHAGETFDQSYFIGREGDDIKVVRASDIVPEDVQKTVAESAAVGKEPEAVITPEAAVAQITASCGGTIAGFKKWAADLKPAKACDSAEVAKAAEKAADVAEKASELAEKAEDKAEALEEKSASKKVEAQGAPTFSMSEKEVSKVEMPKAGEVIKSVDKKEASEDAPDIPNGTKSKVKQYYSQLPTSGGGNVDKTINLQSSEMQEKYKKAIKALDEQLKKNDDLKKENDDLVKGKDKVEKELGGIKDEVEVERKKKDVEEIISGIVAGGVKFDAEAEKMAVDELSKLDAKSLKTVAKVIKGLFGSKEGKDLPAPNPFESKKASMEGVNLPQIGASVAGSDLIATVSRLFEHN